jgi:hypothetical protein
VIDENEIRGSQAKLSHKRLEFPYVLASFAANHSNDLVARSIRQASGD